MIGKLICVLIMGFSSIYLFDKCLPAWIGLVCVGFFVLMTSKREFVARGPWGAMNIKERLSRNTTPPVSIIKATQEQYALNQEAGKQDTQTYRMREIAKRLIFLDGYMAGKIQK